MISSSFKSGFLIGGREKGTRRTGAFVQGTGVILLDKFLSKFYSFGFDLIVFKSANSS